ncbi:MAG: glycosyltransferase 87 family protein [Bacteroidota bacterium]
MKRQSGNWLIYLSGLPIILIAWYFSRSVEQPDFSLILGCFGIFFAFYMLVWSSVKTENETKFFIGVAILTRLLMITAMPNLSDDFFRFIWDGRLACNGINPYLYLPTELIENQSIVDLGAGGSDLYQSLNSKGYFSVYPPVNQLVFALAAFSFPFDILGSVTIMKLTFVLAEAGTILLAYKLCVRFKLPPKTVLLYALNPLIILETYNNLHFEIVMIFFVALAIWWLVNDKPIFSAVAMGFAISTKLLPLMFLPFLIKTLGWKRSIQYCLTTGVVVLCLFSPVLNHVFLQNFLSSVELYFRKFEFNASVYYILRWIGYQTAGYNIIQMLGPLLGGITALIIFLKALFGKVEKVRDLPMHWMLAMSIFLLLSTTVHPWYLSSIIFLCIFTRYKYPILWSVLIIFTYINYSFESYQEIFWIVAFEYIILGLFIGFELTNGNRGEVTNEVSSQ